MMITYSQNFEDIILERIFKGKGDGLYVDIGACHPAYDSVTQHFYLKGWSGINVEPQPVLFAELQAARQRDINLNLCIGSQPGRQTLYITRNVGTSTLNRELAEQYRQSQNIDQEITVELITLDQLWTKNVQGRHVDFLKIDVEGFEQEVLTGADFSLVSPSILIIEATRPNSSVLCHQQWEMLVLEHYEFFYFDGLNRFYCRKGFSIDTETVCIPPNIFDQFKTYPQVLLEQANSSLTQERDALSKQLKNCLTQLATYPSELEKAQQAYQALEAALESKEEYLRSTLGFLHDKESALLNASQAYQQLESALEVKDQDLREMVVQFQPKHSPIAESDDAYRLLQGHLLHKVDELADLQKHLTEKNLERQEASRAYRALQEILELTQQKLTISHQQHDACSNSLHEATNAYKALQSELNRKEAAFASLQKYVQDKDHALQAASSAYEALQGSFSKTHLELVSTCQRLDAESLKLREATNAYEALKSELSRKEADLASQQKYLQENDLAIQNAMIAYSTLQKEVQDKDIALAHAAQAYKELNDALNTKLRELGELHATFSQPTQPKGS